MKWLLLLHKRKSEFSDTWTLENLACQRFEWMLQFHHFRLNEDWSIVKTLAKFCNLKVGIRELCFPHIWAHYEHWIHRWMLHSQYIYCMVLASTITRMCFVVASNSPAVVFLLLPNILGTLARILVTHLDVFCNSVLESRVREVQ